MTWQTVSETEKRIAKKKWIVFVSNQFIIHTVDVRISLKLEIPSENVFGVVFCLKLNTFSEVIYGSLGRL